MIVVAFSAAVSGNYLTLTARHLIQTLPTLEKKKKKKQRGNGGKEREEEEQGGEKRLKGRGTG